MSETHEAALPAAAPSAQRRLSSQRVREARDRLTTTSGSRAVFDYELLRNFAQNRVSASPVMLLLVVMIGVLSGLWTGALASGIWITGALFIQFIMIRKCREFLAQPRPMTPLMPWRIRFVTLDLFFGMAWSVVLSNPIGADDRASTFMLFVMLLVVAISSMLASSLPIAVLALTLPVTIAITLDFGVKGDLHNYILAIMALTAEGCFSLLAYRLYWTTLVTLQARAEKDAYAVADGKRRAAKRRQIVHFPSTESVPAPVRNPYRKLPKAG